MARSNRSLVCYDCDLARIIGMNEAIVFEWLWFFLHSKEIEKPNGHMAEGRRWARFSYEDLFYQSGLLGSVETLRRTVKALEKQGLIIAKQSRDGKKYAIDFMKLREIIEPWHWGLYLIESDVAGQDDWDMPFEPKVKPPKSNIETSQIDQPETSQIDQPELTTLDTQTNQIDQPAIYKESIIPFNLLSIQEKDLSSDKSPDDALAKSTATKVSRNSAEYKALEAIVQRVIYRGASLDYQGGTLIQYLVIQGATPDTLIKFVNWWKAQYRNADVPRQIQRTAKTDHFQGKFVTRWEEWQIKIKPKPKPTDTDEPIAPILPNPSDEERAAMLATLREGRPK